MYYIMRIGKYLMSMQALNKKCGCRMYCYCFTIYDDTYDMVLEDFYYKQYGKEILKLGTYKIFVTYTEYAYIIPRIYSIEIELVKKDNYVLSKTLYGDYNITLRDSVDIIDSVNIVRILTKNCKIFDHLIIDYIYGFI